MRMRNGSYRLHSVIAPYAGNTAIRAFNQRGLARRCSNVEIPHQTGTEVWRRGDLADEVAWAAMRQVHGPIVFLARLYYSILAESGLTAARIVRAGVR